MTVLADVLSHFITVIDGITDAAVLLDRELHPVAWNKSYIQACGLKYRGFARSVAQPETRCRDLFSLEMCDQRCLGKRALLSGRSVRVDEILGRGCRNETQTLIVTAIPVPDDQGEVVGVIEIYRDVSAEARIQDRYKILLNRERERAELLEAEVEKQTADLRRSLEELQATRDQLIQSEKLSSLGRLIAGIAHEINNPITFIYGNLEFLTRYVDALMALVRAYERVSSEAQPTIEKLKREVDFEHVCQDLPKLIQSIELGAERAARIVRDLRAVCHQGGAPFGPVNLTECINRTLTLAQHGVRGRIEIDRHYEAVPMVWGDESRLSQVFMNLVMNALQAIPDRGRVMVSVRRADDGVLAEVADDGIGMSEEVQMKAFDPFFTTKPVGEGTGLGLSIAYSIIDAHGGRIAVKSAPGKGTVFSVWLPAGPPASEAESVLTVADTGSGDKG